MDSPKIGGAKKTPKKTSKKTSKKSDENVRYFKIVEIDGKKVEMGRYKQPNHSRAAKVAFTSICSKYKKTPCNHTFSIQETTQGSNKKIKTYNGKSYGKKKVPLGGKMISVTDRRVKLVHSK